MAGLRSGSKNYELAIMIIRTDRINLVLYWTNITSHYTIMTNRTRVFSVHWQIIIMNCIQE